MARIDDDTLITPSLLKRFVLEAHEENGDGRHCAFIERSNGELLVHHPASQDCAGEQAMFAADVLRRLNRELHHDGAWVIVFTHPSPPAVGSMIFAQPGGANYRRFVLIWLDQDGDVQVPVEWIENESEMLDFPDVLIAGVEWIMQSCENAWDLWNLHMNKVLDGRKKEGETFKRAKGERPASARH